MIDFATAYPNSRKVYDERTARITADGPDVTLRVPAARGDAWRRGTAGAVVRHERTAGARRALAACRSCVRTGSPRAGARAFVGTPALLRAAG
jgi:hypothetical protein